MTGSRRPGLLGTDPQAPASRTPGLLGVNDPGAPGLRLEGAVGDTPGLLGFNDWADPRYVLAASSAAPAAQNSEKSFSELASNRMWGLFKDHPNQVGSKRKEWLLSQGLSDDTQGRQATDCITYVIQVIKHAYEQLGRRDVARRVGGLGQYGAKLADYLVRQVGWKAHYWSPDVNHPTDFNYEVHNYSYWNTLKHGVYYVGSFNTGVPVSGYVVNYKPVANYMDARYEDKRRRQKHNYPTTPETAAFERLKQVRFAYGIARGGDHTFIYSEGYVFEVHWTALGDDRYATHVDADGDDLYERSPFADFPWQSGIMVVPPDSDFESDRKTPPTGAGR